MIDRFAVAALIYCDMISAPRAYCVTFDIDSKNVENLTKSIGYGNILHFNVCCYSAYQLKKNKICSDYKTNAKTRHPTLEFSTII